jgi:cell division septal protein FtsQ
LKQNGPIKQGKPNTNRAKRPKMLRPSPPRSPSEGGRRAAQVYNGREFIYSAKGSAKSATGGALPHARPKPGSRQVLPEHHHLSKVGASPRRRRNVKMRNVWLILGVVAMSAAVIYGIGYCLTSPYFTVSGVTISGIPTQDTSAIESSVAADALGHNEFLYWLTNHRRIASEVASSEADFGHVSLRMRLPDSLVINIVPREPVMLISFGPNGSFGAWMLDNTGLPIRDQLSPRWNERPANMIKVIADPRSVQPGDLAFIRNGQPLPASVQNIVTNAFALETELRISPLAPNVGSIRVDNSGYLGLNMDSHLLIKLGDINSLDKKLALAWALESQRADLVSSSRYIDVTDPNWPAVMPISAPVTKVAVTKPTPAVSGLVNQGSVPQ